MTAPKAVMVTDQCDQRDAELDRCIRPLGHDGPCHFMAPATRTPAPVDPPQWIVVGPDDRELLISFWDGITADPEVAPRLDHTRWGAPLQIRRLDSAS